MKKKKDDARKRRGKRKKRRPWISIKTRYPKEQTPVDGTFANTPVKTRKMGGIREGMELG